MINILLITIPIFLVIFIGKLIKIIGLIDNNFINSSNKLIFNLCLPILLFNKIANADIKSIFDVKMVLIMYSSVFIVFSICFLIAKLKIISSNQAGSLMMNSFRSNFAYMGLPVSYFAYGDKGLLSASLLMAFIVPYVNMLSIFSLTIFTNQKKSLKLFLTVILNPLAFACILGILFSILNIQIPDFLQKTLDIISGITLPLALFCIGASLNMKSYGNKIKSISISVFMKLIVLPATAFILINIFYCNLTISTKTLVILLASPAATVNYILASTLNGDTEMTNGSIIISTLLSVFSFIIWLSILGI